MNAFDREAIRPLLECAGDFVLVELGAYCGEETNVFEQLRGMRPFLHIMVEPDPRNIPQILLRPLTRNRRLWRGAIAAQSGRVIFRCSDDSRDGSRGSGSIMEPSGHLEHFPTITFSHEVEVDAFTLDEIFAAEGLPRIDLLWADIQGAEAEMIRGGQHALSKTRYLFMEAESVEMYKGQALKQELIAMLPGWELVADLDFNVLLHNTRFA